MLWSEFTSCSEPVVASSFTQLPTAHSIKETAIETRTHGHNETTINDLRYFVDNISILSFMYTGCCVAVSLCRCVGVSVWWSFWSCVAIRRRCYCFYRSCVSVCVCISAVMCVGGVSSLCVCNHTDHVLFVCVVCEHITATQYPATVYTHTDTHSQLIRMTMRLCL